jgi:phage terminase large subunit-like protein
METTFDPRRAAKVCNFFERILRHPSAGLSAFKLLRWERSILRRVFGNVDASGLRIIRKVYLEVAKKNGKSELAAGIALYCLLEDNEPACEVYGAATVKKQAGIVFNTAAAMVRASPELRKRLKVIRSTKRIVKRDDPSSFYAVIAADGDAEDGINPHCVIIDELHRWKTAKALELYEVLTRGNVARRQPIVWEITTAGSTEEESPLCWREHNYAINHNSGEFSNPHFFGKIFAIDSKDDWTNPKAWEKANPSLETLGGFLKLSKLQELCQEAIDQPSRQPAFKRFHCGIWLSMEALWMDPEIWARNAGELRRLVERPCYLGLDLSRTTDLTSLVLLFPDASDESFDVLPFFWMAREQVRVRELADHVPYGTWVAQKKIEATNGEVIDLRDIKRKIKWCAEVFSVQQVAFDPAHADQLAIELTEELGLKCVPVPQRYTHLSEPMKKVMELALRGKFRHAAHPVLSWNMKCVKVRTDGEDNIRPVKPDRNKDNARIDGAVALILAMSRALFHAPSRYEKEGLMIL